MKEYAKEKYQQVLDSTLAELKREHPELFFDGGDDSNKFKEGHTTTSGMEGGNWRVKYSVRVPHQRNDSAAGRSILATIKDSVFGMRSGKVKESLANKLGFFSFANIMSGVSGIQR